MANTVEIDYVYSKSGKLLFTEDISAKVAVLDPFVTESLNNHAVEYRRQLQIIYNLMADTSDPNLIRPNDPIHVYKHLNHLRRMRPDLFYAITLRNMELVCPFIYTPTVGQACKEWTLVMDVPEGIYLQHTLRTKKHIKEQLERYPKKDKVLIAVVTDGSRILGLGDLGVNGMPISIGKLSLYCAAAGIHPDAALPICLDFGTNNEEYLADEFYFGLKEKRTVTPAQMTEFVDEFVQAFQETFPHALLQFEDFATPAAIRYLDRYGLKPGNKIPSSINPQKEVEISIPIFNDDIQGTGSVILGGFLEAMRLSNVAVGDAKQEHRIIFFGAGSAGVGVAQSLMHAFSLLGYDYDIEAIKDKFYFVDSKGLVYNGRPDLGNFTDPRHEHKKFFARNSPVQAPGEKPSLLALINTIKPTALIGLSTIPDMFTEPIIRAMAKHNPRPIIFPLSNPVKRCECTFEQAIRWTDGKVIFASGSPFPPVVYEGTTYFAGQGNNMYIFPGLGLGAIHGRTTCVSEEMLKAASEALNAALTDEERKRGLIYPELSRIRDISRWIAKGVVRAAYKQGFVTSKDMLEIVNDDHRLDNYFHKVMWVPEIDPERRQLAG